MQEFYPGVDFDVLIPPDEKLGDYSTNLSFVLAKKEGRKPVDVGKEVTEKLLSDGEFSNDFRKIELAGGGFINFFIKEKYLYHYLDKIISEEENYGAGDNKNFNINLEFVSANPTGPLTVGNARAASYGDTLGNILKKSGYKIKKEYYVNDVGVQVDKLTKSEINVDMKNRGLEPKYKEEGLYTGEYIFDSAADTALGVGVYLDRANFEKVKKVAVKNHVDLARTTLEKMGVKYDEWFFEHELHNGEIDSALDRLKKSGLVEEKEGATWFRFDSDKSAVLIKSDGNKTYLMGDVAYTLNKLEKRGFDRAINIWGTDHHGDVPRLLAATKVLGHDSKLQIILHQLVTLKRKDEKLKISKRAGNLVFLDGLMSDVGKDATRFFFLSKDLNTHMEFDIDLAKEQSTKNPVYYIQYAYARLNSIFTKLRVENEKLKINEINPALLKEEEELILMRKMVKFPELIEEISKSYQVHHLAQYTYELASCFHNFYEKHHVAQDNDKELERTRLFLCSAVRIVLEQCLSLMGISAPDKM